jgi:hypothetical protein
MYGNEIIKKQEKDQNKVSILDAEFGSISISSFVSKKLSKCYLSRLIRPYEKMLFNNLHQLSRNKDY